jgi:RNA polymerase sigma factor (sigma-70 family)
MTRDHQLPPDSSEQDLEQMLERHLPELRAYIRLRSGELVRRMESSSDLVQSVCLETLREKGRVRFRSEAAFRQWLFRAAERKIIDRARFWRAERRDGTRELHPEPDQSADRRLLTGYATLMTPSQHVIAREQVARLEAAFDALPSGYRGVITAVRYLGLSYAELAAQSGRSEGAVRIQMFRALARLSELLAASR